MSYLEIFKNSINNTANIPQTFPIALYFLSAVNTKLFLIKLQCRAKKINGCSSELDY